MKITDSILKPLRKKALFAIYLQLCMMLVVALIWLTLRGFPSFFSAILGGIAWTIPNFYFIRKIFKTSNTKTLEDIAKDFYIGETVKLLMSGILIILFVKLFALALPAFLSAYVSVVMTSFFVPIMVK